jgi:methyl-CpG-binding domain protein 4
MVEVMATPMRDDLMVQQQITSEWQHMVGVIMLNQTHRQSVKRVLPEFLSYWDTCEKFINSTPEEVYTVIRPLGLVAVREKRIRMMSNQYLTWDKNDAKVLYGIGKYGSDSYEIFFKQNYTVQPTDKELLRYLEEDVNAIT